MKTPPHASIASPPAEDIATSSPSHVPHDQHLRQLLDYIPDAILWIDRSWKITFANDEARRISRLTSDHLNHRTHWEIFPETLDTELETRYHRAMSERVPEHFEYFYAPFQLWLDIH